MKSSWTKRAKVLYSGATALVLGGTYLALTSHHEFLRGSLGMLFLGGGVWLVKASMQERRQALLNVAPSTDYLRGAEVVGAVLKPATDISAPWTGGERMLKQNPVQLLLRTIRGTGDFWGRSRRTEVIYYWIACVVIGGGINIAVASAVTDQQSTWFQDVFDSILLIPMFAQFVRRLHDQNRSGWWGLILPLTYLLGVPDTIAGARLAVPGTPTITPFGAASMVLGIVYFVLCLLPGTNDRNDYGPDPRQRV